MFSVTRREYQRSLTDRLRCNSRIVITFASSTTDALRKDPKSYMVGDRGPGTADAAPGHKKLEKITSTKMGSIYPTVTQANHTL